MQINFNNNENSNHIQDTSTSEYQQKCGIYQELFKQPQIVSQNSIQSQNYVMRNANTVSPAMFKQKKRVNEPILSNPVVIMKYQMNQRFQNQQTIQNQVREKTNSDQRKELLSFFNENRYKYFSNNDLNAEKFFVTRNRERIKDLNFERIGIFKSKQPQTHVKHLRFFVNDLKITEPRFQNPLKIEQEQLSQEQSFRKASHASHNSKLSSSDLVKETVPNFKEAPLNSLNQVRYENISKGTVNSPINNNIGSNSFSFGNLNPSQTQILSPQERYQVPGQMQQITPTQSYQNTPSKLTAAATSPQQSSGQSKFQFININNNDTNGNQQYSSYESVSDNKDTANVKKLKQQYMNFVQQNFNPKLQQAKLVNNLIKEEKEESIIEEEHNQKQDHQNQTEANLKKLTILLNSEDASDNRKSDNRLPSLKQIKNNKKQRVNIVDERDLAKNINSQQNIASDRDINNNKKLTSDIFIPFTSKNDIISPINQQNLNNKLSLNKFQQNLDNQKSQNQLLATKNSIEFDNNYMVCMQIDKETDNEYIYSKQFQDQIRSLEDEQKRLESIENLFFLKLSPEEYNYYHSESFKIHRKKMLLDTILKNKKITTRDKKLIFLNLLYQYNIKSRLNSKEWCIEMTNFLMKNKFKYNLDEAANRKYERAHQKIVQLPTFRDARGEIYHDSYNFFHQVASPTPISTESNEVHYYTNEIDTINQLNQGKQNLNIKRFKPKQLSKTYSHFQFQKIKY
ncbi:hypothetical protein TTHERM_00822210 (macronuclear) [Tetrahymena thermophila SB210]|uniref:Uncharacterized protein n=1 Tax=Tetrahymena thermophila (strain SB210) TaxID=312017 RepID=Q22EZ2_TETTS|nr:hypothetical protein TTHERM_00822210 [Tetrahymena thermophila SB210]EAR83883.2 hypothetical protein TTHERM_00822210 [Tetrahymena thermophila SB210]|eukprot:XP_001031546.2 hypothetical protein TTHERM_00822210 [Tetrahymena thermophila SB210]